MLFPGRYLSVDVSSSINLDYTFDLCSESYSFILRLAPKTGKCLSEAFREELFSETFSNSDRFKILFHLTCSAGSLQGD